MTEASGKNGCLTIVAAFLIIVVAYITWDRSEDSKYPFRILNSGVWERTETKPVYDTRGQHFGDSFETTFYKFSEEKIEEFHFFGKFDSEGVTSYGEMKEIGKREQPILAVSEFPSEDQARVVIKTQNQTYTFVLDRKGKRFEMYLGNLFIGHIYKDSHYSAHPTDL